MNEVPLSYELVGRVSFDHAGASSKQVYRCPNCGALILWEDEEKHTEFHMRLLGIAT